MKRKSFKWFKLTALLILFISTFSPYSASATSLQGSDLVSVSKSINKTSLVRGAQEVADVTLTVKGTPQESTFVQPNDVILIIDKSGSMADDNRLAAAKAATKEFLDLIDTTKHRVGIVDFSASSSSYQLSSDIDAAKAYVDKIQLGGGTNTGDAIRQATSMLASKRAEAQPTIVILTDGEANNTSDALASSQVAKDAGIIFYSIALLAPNEDPSLSAPNDLLRNMATSADHHHFVLGSVGLPEVYRQIVEEIGLASAYNVVITDTVSPEFEIVPGSYDNNIPKPTVNGNTLQWHITELKSNELTFTYQIRLKDTATAGKISLGTTSTIFEDHAGNSYSVDTSSPTIQVTNPAPIISEINANKGLTAGGETVSIKGQNFLEGAKVYFGSNLATVSSISAEEIIVTAPSGTQGQTVDVKVSNTDGQFATGQYSYYDNPTLNYVTPAEGKMEGGNQIYVYGSKFLKGATVYINDVAATTSYVSSTTLQAKVPASEVYGPVTVKIVNPDGTEAELDNGYTYLEPITLTLLLDSLSKVSGELKGGELIYLNGQNFDKDIKVYFGSNQASIDSYLSSTSIRVTVPVSELSGFVNVKVENPDGSTSELSNAYEYLEPQLDPAPEIISLSLTSLLVNETKTVYIEGKNFKKLSKVFVDGKSVVTTYVSDTSLAFIAPKSTEVKTVDIEVINPDGQTALLEDGLSYVEPILGPAPIITSLSQNSGPIQGGDIITIIGENFQDGAKVYFGGVLVTVISTTDTTIEVKVPARLTPLMVDVNVINPDKQQFILSGGYNYLPNPITVTKLSRESGPLKGGNTIYISGTEFTKTGMTLTVDGNIVKYQWVSKTSIYFTLPKASVIGPVEITLQDASGNGGSLNFTYY